MTGVIGAPVNGSGIIGGAPGTSIMPIRIATSTTHNGGDWLWMTLGIDFAVRKEYIHLKKNKVANIINLSFSAPPDNVNDKFKCGEAFKINAAVKDAIKEAIDRGVFRLF
jgi:hypothetical protein